MKTDCDPSPQGDIIKLEGYEGRYRLREVHIAEIKHRREAYRE